MCVLLFYCVSLSNCKQIITNIIFINRKMWLFLKQLSVSRALNVTHTYINMMWYFSQKLQHVFKAFWSQFISQVFCGLSSIFPWCCNAQSYLHTQKKNTGKDRKRNGVVRPLPTSIINFIYRYNWKSKQAALCQSYNWSVKVYKGWLLSAGFKQRDIIIGRDWVCV